MTRRACGKGWWPLLDRLEADLQALGFTRPPEQVKEKFGTLCYYAWAPDWTPELREAVYARIREAEAESARTCEWCGASGTLDTRYPWLFTLCAACQGERTTKRGA